LVEETRIPGEYPIEDKIIKLFTCIKWWIITHLHIYLSNISHDNSRRHSYNTCTASRQFIFPIQLISLYRISVDISLVTPVIIIAASTCIILILLTRQTVLLSITW
jgi:ABC-type Co2+ transport system permease subunit